MAFFRRFAIVLKLAAAQRFHRRLPCHTLLHLGVVTTEGGHRVTLPHHRLIFCVGHLLGIPHRLILVLEDLTVVDTFALANVHLWIFKANFIILLEPVHLGAQLFKKILPSGATRLGGCTRVHAI